MHRSARMYSEVSFHCLFYEIQIFTVDLGAIITKVAIEMARQNSLKGQPENHFELIGEAHLLH